MVVKDVVPGFAADACGNIKPGDVLVSIDGRPLSRLSLEQVKGLMLGIPGSRAVLEVIRNDQAPFNVEVTRVSNIRSPPSTKSSFG